MTASFFIPSQKKILSSVIFVFTTITFWGYDNNNSNIIVNASPTCFIPSQSSNRNNKSYNPSSKQHAIIPKRLFDGENNNNNDSSFMFRQHRQRKGRLWYQIDGADNGDDSNLHAFVASRDRDWYKKYVVDILGQDVVKQEFQVDLSVLPIVETAQGSSEKIDNETIEIENNTEMGAPIKNNTATTSSEMQMPISKKAETREQNNIVSSDSDSTTEAKQVIVEDVIQPPKEKAVKSVFQSALEKMTGQTSDTKTSFEKNDSSQASKALDSTQFKNNDLLQDQSKNMLQDKNEVDTTKADKSKQITTDKEQNMIEAPKLNNNVDSLSTPQAGSTSSSEIDAQKSSENNNNILDKSTAIQTPLTTAADDEQKKINEQDKAVLYRVVTGTNSTLYSIPLSKMTNFGYSDEEVESLEADALALIVEQNLKRPSAGIPSGWKIPNNSINGYVQIRNSSVAEEVMGMEQKAIKEEIEKAQTMQQSKQHENQRRPTPPSPGNDQYYSQRNERGQYQRQRRSRRMNNNDDDDDDASPSRSRVPPLQQRQGQPTNKHNVDMEKVPVENASPDNKSRQDPSLLDGGNESAVMNRRNNPMSQQRPESQAPQQGNRKNNIESQPLRQRNSPEIMPPYDNDDDDDDLITPRERRRRRMEKTQLNDKDDKNIELDGEKIMSKPGPRLDSRSTPPRRELRSRNGAMINNDENDLDRRHRRRGSGNVGRRPISSGDGPPRPRPPPPQQQQRRRPRSPDREYFVNGRPKRIYTGRPPETKSKRRRQGLLSSSDTNNDPPTKSFFWPDIDSFRDMMEDEAALRLGILGKNWAPTVKKESEWRVNMYKRWLWLLHNGIGEPMVPTRQEIARMQQKRDNDKVTMEQRERNVATRRMPTNNRNNNNNNDIREYQQPIRPTRRPRQDQQQQQQQLQRPPPPRRGRPPPP